MKGDLKALSSNNLLFKYADDTNLLVLEITDVDIKDEFNNVLKWAADNCMTVNFSKTKEIVFSYTLSTLFATFCYNWH